MLKKDITYKNLDGVTVTRAFYFNLTKAEMAELELRHPGGFPGFLERISATSDNEKLIAEFKNIIMSTYGMRDGDDFIKTQDLRDRFASSEAYSELFIEWLTVPGALETFIKGVVPKDYGDLVKTDTPAVKPSLIPPSGPMAHVTPQQVEMGNEILKETTNG